MATIGQTLTSPESGWQRTDDTNPKISYVGSGWTKPTSSGFYNGGLSATNVSGDIATFKFYGTKLRIIDQIHPNRSTNISITIDGNTEIFSEYASVAQNQTLVYEKTGLILKVHDVTIKLTDTAYLSIDAIDIDSTGYIVTPVGQQLTASEVGWKRYDDFSPSIKYVGTKSTNTADTGHYNSTISYLTQLNDHIDFDFIGTNLRIITSTGSNRADSIEVKVDGIVMGTYSGYTATAQYQILSYELLGLENKRHNVVITSKSTTANFQLTLDAIDIDSTGRVLHPDEVIDIKDLDVGKRIRAHYSALSGVTGSFNNLGKETSDFIPAASSATPNGDFYLVMVENWNGQRKLIADRNIQHTISWDTLNSSGFASGLFHNYNLQKPVVASYNFNESATTLFDKVGSNNGVITGTTIISSSNGGARSFNGTSDYIRFNGNPLIPTGKKSIKMRIRISSIPSALGYVFANIDNSTVQHGITINVGTDGKLNVGGGNASAGARWIVTTPTNICDNQWHNILFTWDGTTNTNAVKLYVDDMTNPLVQATSSSVEPSSYYTGGTNIGRLGGTGTTGYLKFDLDELKIYNDVVDSSSSDIKVKNYNFTTKLLTGGTSAYDIDSEWDKYVVSSTLNNTIVAGDNNVWNWNGKVGSWTSTTPSGTPANRVQRGPLYTNAQYGSTVDYWGHTTSSSSDAARGFRPMIIIEDLKYLKHLIQDNSNLFNIDLSTHTPNNIGTEINKSTFDLFGMDDLSSLSRNITTLNKVLGSSETLGSGKKLKYTLNVDIDDVNNIIF